MSIAHCVLALTLTLPRTKRSSPCGMRCATAWSATMSPAARSTSGFGLGLGRTCKSHVTRQGSSGDDDREPLLPPGLVDPIVTLSVCRFNCLDSLDRTTVASFFIALQMLAEQCSKLSVGLLAEPGGGTTRLGWNCLQCDYTQFFQTLAPQLVCCMLHVCSIW